MALVVLGRIHVPGSAARSSSNRKLHLGLVLFVAEVRP